MTTKKFLLTAVAVFTMAAASNAGAPPTVMFLPDETWCYKNNFYRYVEGRNGKEQVNDYSAALKQNSDLKNVVTQLNALMSDNGLPALSYTSYSGNDATKDAIVEMYEGKEDGASVEKSDYERILERANPDIIIYVGWDVNRSGFNSSISYRLTATDSYSGKEVAPITAETPPMKSGVPLAAALKMAATEHMPEFISKLQNYFDGVQENGREITLTCAVNSNSGVDFDTEFGDDELAMIITDWLSDNTVNSNYTPTTQTANQQDFIQVKIPLKDERGRVLNAKGFANNLNRYLRKKCGLRGQTFSQGLGKAFLMDIKPQ